jgi:antitoxin HigA-1
MVRIPTNRKATHPGEVLREDFLLPMDITQTELAESIHVPFQRINEIVSGKRGVTPATALRLSKYFRNSAGFWLNLQMRYDLQQAEIKEKSELAQIRPTPKLAA